MIKTYRSKISYWLLAITLVVVFTPIILALNPDGLAIKTIIITITMTLFFVFILYLSFKTEFNGEKTLTNSENFHKIKIS